MAVSKTLRFEVLRRDDFTCRYCGLKAPETELHVDHVTPVTLGGGDDPGNLVAACKDCNAGKGKIPPGAPLVADVEADALRWAAAIRRSCEIQMQQLETRRAVRSLFERIWNKWSLVDTDERFPLPHDWQTSIDRFSSLGAGAPDFHEAVRIAMESQASFDDKYRYFAGVMWQMLRERQKLAAELIAEDQAE